jgi:hypothetical protein
MRDSRKIGSILIVSMALLASGTALAAPAAPKACQSDVKKLCKSAKAGEGGVLACLEKNSAKVSQACQGALTDAAQAVQSACKPELDQFCAQVEHGEGRLLQCLAKHEADMGADCKAFWSKAKSKSKPAAK